MKITIEIVEDFLRSLKKDRTWLAEEIGCSRGTLNNWFSKREFPLWAEKAICRIIQDHEQKQRPSADDLQFSYSDWKTIQAAMEKTGARDITSFIQGIMVTRAQEIVDSDEVSF